MQFRDRLHRTVPCHVREGTGIRNDSIMESEWSGHRKIAHMQGA